MENTIQTWEEPIGEHNYPHKAEITNDGILIDGGICLLEWDWIDAARTEMLSQKLATIEKRIQQLEHKIETQLNPKHLVNLISYELRKQTLFKPYIR